MKFKYRLNVSAEEYYSFLRTFLLKELKKYVDKKITQKDMVAGFCFEREYKGSSQNYVSKQEILYMEENKKYGLRMQIPQGYQSIIHTIKVFDTYRIEIAYEEKLEVKDISLKLKQRLMASKMKKAMYKNMKRIEEDIIRKRKTNDAKE